MQLSLLDGEWTTRIPALGIYTARLGKVGPELTVRVYPLKVRSDNDDGTYQGNISVSEVIVTHGEWRYPYGYFTLEFTQQKLDRPMIVFGRELQFKVVKDMVYLDEMPPYKFRKDDE